VPQGSALCAMHRGVQHLDGAQARRVVGSRGSARLAVHMNVSAKKSLAREERATIQQLGRRPVKPAVEARIRQLRANGHGILKIGRKLGIGTSVVQRVVGAVGPQ
jgi:DNA invertase Pin-like site-specific DNA recombinase